jgi:hypothetical protein
MGVGAAIANGSQGEKGNRALLVMKVRHRRSEREKGTSLGVNLNPFWL